MIQKFKMGRKLSGGVGPQKPVEGWLDLRLGGATQTVGLYTDGFHTYNADIALGPIAVNTTIDRDAGGLFFVNNVNLSSCALFRSAACSLQYDPVFEWIIYRETGDLFLVIIGSEEISDAPPSLQVNPRRLCYVTTTSALNTIRAHTAWTTFTTFTDPGNGWFRLKMEHNDGGLFSMHRLPSGDPSDWDDPGTEIFSARWDFGSSVVGGNLLTPGIAPRGSVATVKCLAVKTTMRLK